MDLGITYFGLEDEDGIFDVGLERLITHISDQNSQNSRRNPRRKQGKEVCGVEEDLCRRYGPNMTFYCRCGKRMHDLCDWPSVTGVENVEYREGRGVYMFANRL